MIQRTLYKSLLAWKASSDRKPLILRGARQVGKTTLVKEFSREYPHFLYLNLEKAADRFFFEQFDDVTKLIDALFISRNLRIPEPNQLLLFIDEIQEFPDAIARLRYFYEELPHIHVIAAGSLLEFAMGKIHNFPVGRVEYLYLHPLSFEEFLGALDQTVLLQAYSHIPVSDVASPSLMKVFNLYAIVGGMPAVVQRFAETGQIASLTSKYEGIWSGYKNDIPKYAESATHERVLRHILGVAPTYLDERVTFQHFGNSNYKSREVGEAFRMLHQAGVVKLVYPTTDIEPPARPDFRKSPRLQFLDSGLLNYTLEIQPQLLSMNDLSNAFKGRLIPHVVYQECISRDQLQERLPMFWVREKNQSSAEVDLLVSHRGFLIPVEIKSGPTGKLRSLLQFMEVTPHHWAIRIFAGELSIQEQKTPSGKLFHLLNLPYYLAGKLPEYIDFFMSKFPAENV